MASVVQNDYGATESCVVQPVEVPAAEGSSGGSQDGQKKNQSDV